MTCEHAVADPSRPSDEPLFDCEQPGRPAREWFDGLTADEDDDDDRRRLLRELVMRALV